MLWYSVRLLCSTFWIFHICNYFFKNIYFVPQSAIFTQNVLCWRRNLSLSLIWNTFWLNSVSNSFITFLLGPLITVFLLSFQFNDLWRFIGLLTLMANPRFYDFIMGWHHFFQCLVKILKVFTLPQRDTSGINGSFTM